ncbi:MAG: class I SAM-dependent rRNA methyltransferase [Deltaproteobacteria bacterium]|nr:class I SAM-dependent rRNA methyltransferase [Deltaproteobacteria bacterium]
MEIKVAWHELKKTYPWIPKKALNKNDLRRLDELQEGDIVKVESGGRVFYAYFENGDRIIFKIFSEKEPNPIRSFQCALQRALAYRKKLRLNSNAMRLFFSEADRFPGIIIDDYEEIAVVQITSQGLRPYASDLLDCVKETIGKNQVMVKSEFIEQTDSQRLVRILEGDVQFYVDLGQGHKTGFYLDQRANRLFLSKFAESNSRVLDLFCYTGGFGVHFLKQGAKEVTFVDESSKAIELLEENLRINKLSGAKIFRKDSFEFLRNHQERETYDIIVCDPPAFTSKREHQHNALVGFKKLANLCVKILKDNGIFVLFSCSWHISLVHLEEVLKEVSNECQSSVLITHYLLQDVDHPYLLNFPPSLYLKGVVCRVIRNK